MNILGRTESGGSKKTHRMGGGPRGMKYVVLGCRGRYFGGLVQHLPCAFVRHVVELLERPMFGRDELPQIDCPPLAGQDSANEHDLDHIEKLDLLDPHTSDAGVESGQLRGFALGQALLLRPLVGRRDQHLRQESISWAFWQRKYSQLLKAPP